VSTQHGRETGEPERLVRRVREAVAEGSYELGIDVVVHADRIVLLGTAATPEQRAEIVRLAEEAASGYQIVDELRVAILEDSDEVEEIG
jgi:hypothetical protein